MRRGGIITVEIDIVLRKRRRGHPSLFAFEFFRDGHDLSGSTHNDERR